MYSFRGNNTEASQLRCASSDSAGPSGELSSHTSVGYGCRIDRYRPGDARWLLRGQARLTHLPSDGFKIHVRPRDAKRRSRTEPSLFLLNRRHRRASLHVHHTEYNYDLSQPFPGKSFRPGLPRRSRPAEISASAPPAENFGMFLAASNAKRRNRLDGLLHLV